MFSPMVAITGHPDMSHLQDSTFSLLNSAVHFYTVDKAVIPHASNMSEWMSLGPKPFLMQVLDKITMSNFVHFQEKSWLVAFELCFVQSDISWPGNT